MEAFLWNIKKLRCDSRSRSSDRRGRRNAWPLLLHFVLGTKVLYGCCHLSSGKIKVDRGELYYLYITNFRIIRGVTCTEYLMKYFVYVTKQVNVSYTEEWYPPFIYREMDGAGKRRTSDHVFILYI